MSKTLSQSRTVFVGLIALLQLFLLPATQVLHVGCRHLHDDKPAAAVFNAVETAWKWCSSSHCCDHCSRQAVATDDQQTNSAPVHPPHDEDSCPVCQAVSAARIATASAVDLVSTEPVCEVLSVDSPAVDSTPRYRVLSRGPPVASLG